MHLKFHSGTGQNLPVARPDFGKILPEKVSAHLFLSPLLVEKSLRPLFFSKKKTTNSVFLFLPKTALLSQP